MGLRTFIGGVHPYEGKELSADKPMQVMFPGKELVFPLSQHIGAPATALVKKGDTVEAHSIRFTAEKMDGRRIDKIKVVIRGKGSQNE